ncbi:MAG: YlbF family regulator [Planctomycetota bacterium]
MPDTPAIVAHARRLGEMIADHDAAKQLEAALKALEGDVDAQRALTDLNRHLQAIAEKERDGRPIEVEDKHRAESLQKAVVRSKTLRDLQVAQMDYSDLMRQVQDAIERDTPDAPASPTA